MECDIVTIACYRINLASENIKDCIYRSSVVCSS